MWALLSTLGIIIIMDCDVGWGQEGIGGTGGFWGKGICHSLSPDVLCLPCRIVLLFFLMMRSCLVSVIIQLSSQSWSRDMRLWFKFGKISVLVAWSESAERGILPSKFVDIVVDC